MVRPWQKLFQNSSRTLPKAPARRSTLATVFGGSALVACLLATGGLSAESGRAQINGSLGALPDAARAELEQLLYKAGLRQVAARSVERTPERQVAVMLALVEEDAERAAAMYCDAGDKVLESYDAQRSRQENTDAMLRTLLAELPRARELGCLNHIENEEVVSVDIRLADIPTDRHEKLIQLAEAAVQANRLVRFLAPPREPDAFHFEFRKSAPVESSPSNDKPKQQ